MGVIVPGGRRSLEPLFSLPQDEHIRIRHAKYGVGTDFR